MTKLGKLLVFLNVALSLLFATWAGFLLALRVDWSVDKNKGGELAARKEKIDTTLKNALPQAELRWKAEQVRLAALETPRPAERKWYADQFQILRETATIDKPAKLVSVVEGRAVPDAKNAGRPTLVDAKDPVGRPLQSLRASLRDLEVAEKDLAGFAERLDKALEEDKTLLAKINGEKGLIARRETEKVKRERVIEEVKEVEPLKDNTRAELQQFQSLRDRLMLRIDELQKRGTAGTRD
jgi:hypothetical protein